MAVLQRFNPIPIEGDESRSEVDDVDGVDECIFRGFLRNEPTAEVVVTGGCPDDNTFDVR